MNINVEQKARGAVTRVVAVRAIKNKKAMKNQRKWWFRTNA